MSIQIVPQSDPFASVGQAAGEGLSTGLQMLINQKVEGMKRERLQENLKKMGLSPGIADLDPRIAAQVARQEMAQKGLKEFLEGMDEQPPPIREEQPPVITEGEQVSPVEEVPPVAPQTKKGIGRLSDEKLVIATGQGGNVGEIAKAELLRRSQLEKGEARKEEKKADRHSRISEEVLKQAAKTAADLIPKQAAAASMKYAIENRDLSFFSRDNLADITGIEAFRSPEGAVFKFAAKVYFLGSLRKAGARPNQWIEQHIAKMFPLIGRSREANLTVLAAMNAGLDVDKKDVELTDELADASEAKYGFVHRNLGSQVSKKLEIFADKRQDELEIEMKRIQKEFAKPSKGKKASPGMINIVLPDGRIGQVPKDRLKKALELGATRQ